MVMEPSRWFGQTRRQPNRLCTLFCLPYSGAGASMFHIWRPAFDPRVEIMPIHLPGREGRYKEPLGHSAHEIAVSIASRADRAYAIYGHSMGARLGFEVIRELFRLGAPPPIRFYAAAALPPDVDWPFVRCFELPDDEFISALTERINAPAEVWEIPELRDLVLPVLRADFEWIARYKYQPEPPLAIPIIGLAGASDTECGPLRMLGWRRHTSASFRLYTLPGDHFFARSASAELASLLCADMLATSGGAADAVLRPPAADELHVWLAAADDLPGARGAWTELSAQQVLRAGQIRDAAEQRAYITGCVALRRILSRYGLDNGTTRLSAGSDLSVRPAALMLVGASASAGNDGTAVDIERTASVASFDAAADVISAWADGRRLFFETLTEAVR
jgi:surfactin synthase thioesterase subunit